MRKALVALDTDRIKEYVFGTNKLKEIRGASSLLDYLNRVVMEEFARFDPSFDDRCVVYANGGSGLFLVDEKIANDFGKRVQRAFSEVTGGGSSGTYVVQELPADAPDDLDELLKYSLGDTLELMRYHLRAKKDTSPGMPALPSHPFMRQCSACGIQYASPDEPEQEDEGVERDPDEENEFYCISCQKKRRRDVRVKEYIKDIEARRRIPYDEYLWVRLVKGLRENEYNLLPETERPHDFNIFRNFKGTKDYLGLIYADGNGMGKQIEKCDTLEKLNRFAREVDEAIYKAVCFAIARHLKIEEHMKPGDELVAALNKPLFPFDILLLGGDDVMMAVPASSAMEVALTIAEKFHEFTNEEHTLSVGVVLAPIKYPFGLLHDLVSSTLKSGKKEGAKKANVRAEHKSKYGNTRINFMTVTGSTSQSFLDVYASLQGRVKGQKKDTDFYATLRPYNPEQLHVLLDSIREGNKLGLGRSKLHQVREAVLKKNLTTSVSDGLAVLRNWRPRQRNYVMEHVYTLGGIYQEAHRDENKPGSLFPRVTFPWFADGDSTYRTSLLDFVELYDFVAREEGADGDKD